MIYKTEIILLLLFTTWLIPKTRFYRFIERLKVLDVRNYVMNSFLILYIILPALFVVYIYLSVIALHLYRWHRGQLTQRRQKG